MIDLQLENSMLLDMKLDICLSDDYSCTLEVDVFQQLPISKPLCGDLGFNIQGKHVNRFRVRVKILNHGKKLRIHGLNTLNSWFKYSEFMGKILRIHGLNTQNLCFLCNMCLKLLPQIKSSK